jgi:hypothetical protein
MRISRLQLQELTGKRMLDFMRYNTTVLSEENVAQDVCNTMVSDISYWRRATREEVDERITIRKSEVAFIMPDVEGPLQAWRNLLSA